MNFRIVRVVYEDDAARDSFIWMRRLVTKLLIQEIQPPSEFITKLLKESERNIRTDNPKTT